MFSSFQCKNIKWTEMWDGMAGQIMRCQNGQARWNYEPGKHLPQCISKEATLYFNSYTDLLVKCNDFYHKI